MPAPFWDGERWTEPSRRGSKFVIALLLIFGALVAVPTGIYLFGPGPQGGEPIEVNLLRLLGTLMVASGVLAFFGGLATPLLALARKRDKGSGVRRVEEKAGAAQRHGAA